MARLGGSRRTRRALRSGEIDAGTLCDLITERGTDDGQPVQRYEGLRITGALRLDRRRIATALSLVNCVFEEPVDLTGLTVPSLDLSGSTLPGLRADRLTVDGELRLAGTRVGDGTGDPRPMADPTDSRTGRRAPRRLYEDSATAAVRLTDAHIAGNLVVEGLTVADDSPWSLLAPRLTVEGSLHGRGLMANGALYLRDARVTHAVNLHAADVGGIDATGIVCTGFYADWGFRSTGQVLLRAAEVAGVVTFHDAVLAAPAGSLLCGRLRVPRLRLDLREPPAGKVVLQDAAVDVLVDSEATWPAPGALSLEGFTYQRLETERPVGLRARVAWLTRDPRAGARAFEQLARSYESGGDERSARAVRHAKERHLSRNDRLTGRIWGLVQDVLFGYGYAPRRALLWLLSLVALGSAWFASHPPRPVGGDSRRAWDPVLYSLDLLIPVASLGHRGAWDPTGPSKAVALLLVVSGWVLATAVIAGARRVLGRG
ncbi:oxidoreductase [Streptomyces thermospinosisporus]|uniref:Oxidoreductase n=1 Tax=Streptomyces thermospinosisporus TaxID=161482 RepID=A0ABN1YTC7_9ACTN